MDTPEQSLKLRERLNDKPGINYPMLSDTNHRVIDRYGLLNDKARRVIPHPATYVIDPKGVVRWRFVEVDYKIRPSNEDVLRELKNLDVPKASKKN